MLINRDDAVKAVHDAITCNDYAPHKFEEIIAEAASKALRALPVSDGWEDIATAPRDGSRFLAAGGGLEHPEFCTYSESSGCWCCDSCTLDDTDFESQGYNRPTHWKPLGPLPAPPTIE